MQPEHAPRRRLLKGALAFGGTALAGCVVAPYGPYYRPSTAAAGARYRGAWCQGRAGPVAVVELPIAPGVTMTARAQRDFLERDRPELPLRLALTVPAGLPLRFADARLPVVETGSGRTIPADVRVHVYRHARLEPGDWIDLPRIRPGGLAGAPQKSEAPHGSARLQASFERGFTPERLLFDGIAFEHADGPMKLPALRLARPASKASPRDYRSAELHAELVAESAACRRDTPRLACDNIVEHSSVSFRVQQPAARFSGRWFVFGDGADAHIEAEVRVEPHTPGRWRVASPDVRVRDEAGSGRTARIDRVHVATNDRVALDTALFAGRVDGSGDARMTIEVPLPGAVPDFEVALPDLLLGAERIRIAPLRFERRVFDGGIEPFNC